MLYPLPSNMQMAAYILLMLAMVAPLTAHAGGAQRIEFEVQGLQREALIYPARTRATDAAPTLIAFHGRGDTADNFARTARLHRTWRKATVIYPQGLVLGQERSLRGWGRENSDPNHDLALVDALLRDHVQAPQRVFAAGFSNGGRFVFTLMQTHRKAFSAFAAVGAVLGAAETATGVAETRAPAPIIYLFGEFESREYTDAWQRTVVSLAQRNLATGEREAWADGYTLFPAPPNGAPTVYSLYRAGHVWPAGGSRQIVRFFESVTAPSQAGERAAPK